MIRPPKSIITSVRSAAYLQEQEELRLKEEQELAEEKVEDPNSYEIAAPAHLVALEYRFNCHGHSCQ